MDLFENATRRLEAVGVRSPRLLLADRSKDLYRLTSPSLRMSVAERWRCC
ncbi:hypothetical protein [Micromonospora carbonacea]|nr:hypothetical protein [Micromonospora carbonacea]